MNSLDILDFIDIYKSVGGEPVLSGINLSVKPGEIIVIRGRNGVGKTTLAKIAALILRPDRGSVLFNNVNVWSFARYRDQARKKLIGYIDQEYLLLPELSVRENIELSLKIADLDIHEYRSIFDEVVERIGLSNLLDRYPDELSGGQRQRVAIARALVRKPLLVIGDEPYSSLDDISTSEIMNYTREYAKKYNTAFLITTVDLYRRLDSDREYILENGKLIEKK